MAKVKLRRGFPTEANKWALDLRGEMNLASHDPLCPVRLAEHLGVPILKLSRMPDCEERSLLLRKQHDFSAAVCFDGLAAFILTNDGHDLKRQASDIAHELAHVLLRHPPANPFYENGIREFAPEHEAEAERLGPNLLVSNEAAVRALRLTMSGQYSLSSLSDAWGITEQVIQMQINLSGARRRLAA